MGKTIMVIDTDVAYLKMIKTCFTVDGHKVITCDQAEGAFETFLEAKPDAVVTGIVLETEDAGFTLAYQIKKASPTTPVIIVTDVIEKTGIEKVVTGCREVTEALIEVLGKRNEETK